MEGRKMRYDLWKAERDQAENIEGLLLVLRGECPKGPTLKVWRPKATKPHVNYYFRSLEDVEKRIVSELKAARGHIEMVQSRKESRKGTPEQLEAVKIGDIFHFSWGYEQTNVDFYQVIERRGQMLTLREIGQRSTDPASGNGMADYRVAVKDAFVADAKPFTKKLQFSSGKPYITIKSYGWCSLWDGQETYCSWYG
jgi:hypothetical protein